VSQKNTIADDFRRRDLVALYESLVRKNPLNDAYKTNLAELRGMGLLDSHVAGQFGVNYKIGVLVRENIGIKWTLMGFNEPGVPFIILYNIGNVHYESVRKGSQYVFDKNEIEQWNDAQTPQQSCSIANHIVTIGNILSSSNFIDNYIVVNTKMLDKRKCQHVYVIKYIADDYSDNKVAYVQQFRDLCAEIQRRIANGRDFTNLPPIYNIVDDLSNYHVSGMQLAGGERSVTKRSVTKRSITKRNQKESVGKRNIKTKRKSNHTIKTKRKSNHTIKTKRKSNK
jgi:hypothetical protein